MAATQRTPVVTNQQVAATLRQAVRCGLIVSWIDLPNGEWTINPTVGRCHNHDAHAIREYCRMLNQAGVTP